MPAPIKGGGFGESASVLWAQREGAVPLQAVFEKLAVVSVRSIEFRTSAGIAAGERSQDSKLESLILAQSER